MNVRLQETIQRSDRSKLMDNDKVAELLIILTANTNRREDEELLYQQLLTYAQTSLKYEEYLLAKEFQQALEDDAQNNVPKDNNDTPTEGMS